MAREQVRRELGAPLAVELEVGRVMVAIAIPALTSRGDFS